MTEEVRNRAQLAETTKRMEALDKQGLTLMQRVNERERLGGDPLSSAEAAGLMEEMWEWMDTVENLTGSEGIGSRTWTSTSPTTTGTPTGAWRAPRRLSAATCCAAPPIAKRASSTNTKSEENHKPQDLHGTIYMSDNLPILQGIDSGTVDLIATDPPFNNSKEWRSKKGTLAEGVTFKDKWTWQDDVHEPWLDSLRDDHPDALSYIESIKAVREDMAPFGCFLGARLMECKRVLKPTGSIYVYLDHTAVHYVKGLVDAIFGHRNFCNEIVWSYRKVSNSKARKFLRAHDTLLFYSCSAKYALNSGYDDELTPRKQQLPSRRLPEHRSGAQRPTTWARR